MWHTFYYIAETAQLVTLICLVNVVPWLLYQYILFHGATVYFIADANTLLPWLAQQLLLHVIVIQNYTVHKWRCMGLMAWMEFSAKKDTSRTHRVFFSNGCGLSLVLQPGQVFDTRSTNAFHSYKLSEVCDVSWLKWWKFPLAANCI